MLKVWGRSNSINVQKVMWAVAELGLEYERIDVGGKFGGLDSPELLARNPHGLIPVINDDGTIVWESHAIVRYLAAQYGDGSLWPSDPATRSTADMYMEWTQTVLQHDFIQLFWNLYRTSDEQHDHSLLANLTAQCATNFSHMEGLLCDRPYITGQNLTYGDIPIDTQFYRYFTLEIERPSLPRLEAWFSRMCERTAYAEHVMVPYEDLRARLAT
jgi:glutathione S-transferase